jgi:hypothetical protein
MYNVLIYFSLSASNPQPCVRSLPQHNQGYHIHVHVLIYRLLW